jgi:16S rRNA (cytosine967-C5)-methyltransferase
MGVYMLFFMDIANHFVVNELVKMVKKKDYKGSQLVNAIFRSILKQELPSIKASSYLEELSIKYSYPQSLVEEIYKQYPSDIESILNMDYKQNYNIYRINTLKASVEEVVEYLNVQNIKYMIDKTTIWVENSLINDVLFKDGKIIAQDASSQKVGLIANPTLGDRVLDACSAPGGKACHMGTMMNNQGEIICLDVYDHKIELIKENASKQGISIIKPMVQDSRTYAPTEPFDIIVIDAPCSGLGVMDHKVDLKYRMNVESMNGLVNLQKEILENLHKYVKINGYLVYSTCTINQNENNKQMDEFLKNHSNYEKIYEEQILPNNLGDGFYICKLQRKA